MKQRRILRMGLAGGLASATVAGASRGWAEMPQKFGAAFVHHGFGAGAAPRSHFPSNTAPLHAATDDSIDPFDLYGESISSTEPSLPSWGVADDWSKLTTANAASASFASLSCLLLLLRSPSPRVQRSGGPPAGATAML